MTHLRYLIVGILKFNIVETVQVVDHVTNYKCLDPLNQNPN